MAAPKDPGYQPTRGAQRLSGDYVSRVLAAPPLSQSEEVAWATQYSEAKAELERIALESQLGARTFLELSARPWVGDPNQSPHIRYWSRTLDAGAIARAREEILRLEQARAASLRRNLASLRTSSHFLHNFERLSRFCGSALERIEPTFEFVHLALTEQARIAREAERLQPLRRELGAERGCSQLEVASAQYVQGGAHNDNEPGAGRDDGGRMSCRTKTERHTARRSLARLGLHLESIEAAHARAQTAFRLRDEAHTRLVRHNLRLVVWVAKRYIGKGLDFQDLIQEGNFGLLRAVDKFDPNAGFRFSTYAMWWIRQAVQRGLGDKGRTIRMPAHMNELRHKAERTRQALKQLLGREPSLDEVSREIGEPPKKLQIIRGLEVEPYSLDAPLYSFQAPGFTLASSIGDKDTLGPVDHAVNVQRTESVGRLMRVLTKRERYVIRRRFGLSGQPEQTLQEVADDLGVTRERIRQIQARAMAKLTRAAQRRKIRLEDF